MNDRRHRAARKTAAPWADAAALTSLCRARDYLGAHYDDRLTLARGARQAHLSPFYFHRLFTRVFGETPHEFVTRRRIEQADLTAKGVEFSSPPAERFYGIEAIMKDSSGNWYSVVQRKIP